MTLLTRAFCWSVVACGVSAAAQAQGLRITEVMADSEATEDWFEVTNTGTLSVSISGYKMDDNSPDPSDFSRAVSLMGVSNVAAGESVVFLETKSYATQVELLQKLQDFRTFWGGSAQTMQLGYYVGTNMGVSLAKTGDGVTLFSSTGVTVSQVTFGAVQPNTSLYFTTASTGGVSSVTGMDGAYTSAGNSGGMTPTQDVGSPGVFLAVPEPASGILLMVGAALALRRRRSA